ncbi:TPA: acyl carrier protein [bacterium UBP9_UBA11836]|nr:acyl carrier protein [bacterium UBP9_UBA11836]
MENIRERVAKIVVDQLGVTKDRVTDDASFTNDLGADSLDVVEMVMAFENEFGIEIPDEDQDKITNVGDAIKYLSEKAK